MTFEEFLRKEYKDKIPSWYKMPCESWMAQIPEMAMIDLATRWHKEELAKMVPSEKELAETLFNITDKSTNDVPGLRITACHKIATALHKFLEERIK